MSFTFASVGHLFATILKAVGTGAKDAINVITKIEGSETIVETATDSILGAIAPGAVIPATAIEKAAYAALGSVVAVINAGEAAAAAKLLDAGLDKAVVTAAQTLAASTKQVGVLASAAVSSK